MDGRARRVVIAGAGIGGLSAAIALRDAGFQVEVHERAERIAPLGAGLTLQPNAILALQQLGLAAAVEARAAPLRAGALLRADGRPLMKMPEGLVEELQARLGAGTFGIHRATLHDILLGALGAEHVRLGSACAGFTLEAGRLAVRVGSGQLACDALIGADGLHSAVRAALHGDQPPRYAGYTSFRGVTADRCGLPADFGGELWGRGQRFGGCAIDGARFYWYCTLNAPEGQRHERPAAQKAELIARFRHFAHAPALIESTSEQAILRTDISDRPPLRHWGRGPVTLLGDAAHPMTPNLGQGACQAIEDALVLARSLAGAAQLEDGLRAYEQARRARTDAVVLTARRLGAVGQWQNPLACALRDQLFSAVPERATKRQLLDAWQLPSPFFQR